ncbi:hypothetical protein DFH09DRAFT_8519 [Mycena vulgaris]|nr:hypothetical protein DFH09DRAFT_8519 [Mycena vulgaris]
MSDKPSKEQPSYQAHGSLNGNRRLFSFLLAAFILVSFGLRIRGIPLSVQLPFKTTGEEHNADDPRLEPYQNVDDAQDCAEWPTSVDSDRSTVSFDLLKGADLLFFLSRGPVSGHFDIIRKTNNSYPGVSKWITVEVATQYEDESDLRRTKVCRVGNEARNERGVLIWAERGHPQRRVNITVIIPLHLRLHKDITTDLSMFTHDITGTFADWWSPTMFGVLRFKSSDAPIIYNAGLIADSAFIQTSNAQVGGEFTGMNRLHIHTSNAPIGVYAWMSGRGAGSEVTLITSHGRGLLRCHD